MKRPADKGKGLDGVAVKDEAYSNPAIDALEGTDKAVATALHRIVLEVAPQLEPKTWYGFPSYAQGGKVVVFYQPASKFDSRYGTVGFQEDAHLDDQGYVYATLPASGPAGDDAPVVGLIAHVDTSPDAPGEGVEWEFTVPR